MMKQQTLSSRITAVTVYPDQSSDITVSNVQYSLPPKSVNKETGEVIWSVALPKQGGRELTLEFTVEAADSKIILGL